MHAIEVVRGGYGVKSHEVKRGLAQFDTGVSINIQQTGASWFAQGSHPSTLSTMFSPP